MRQGLQTRSMSCTLTLELVPCSSHCNDGIVCQFGCKGYHENSDMIDGNAMATLHEAKEIVLCKATYKLLLLQRFK